MDKVGLYSCKQPCSNCPYRTDAPLQLWDKSEYEKLLASEKEQFGSIYKCHKNNGSICIGWLIKQDENNHPCLSLRVSLAKNKIDRSYLDGLHSPTPLYNTVEEMIEANYPEII